MTKFKALFKKYSKQEPQEIFANFRWSKETGENWDTPFEKLAKLAKSEKWNFKPGSKGYREGQNYPVLKNYLQNTFLRVQEQGKIEYSKNQDKACFNTGLRTIHEKDIYASFYINRKAEEYNLPKWTLCSFLDSCSDQLNCFQSLPCPPTYIEDAADLFFDLNYPVEINFEHIVNANKERLPKSLRQNKLLAINAIEGAVSLVKERLSRNYKIAVPHWYKGKIQLLLPLYLESNSQTDVALVVDKNKKSKSYHIRTILNMDMAYTDARLICPQNSGWLTA